jgi:hypothetical protein
MGIISMKIYSNKCPDLAANFIMFGRSAAGNTTLSDNFQMILKITRDNTITPKALCVPYSLNFSGDGSMELIKKPTDISPIIEKAIIQCRILAIKPYEFSVFLSITYFLILFELSIN